MAEEKPKPNKQLLHQSSVVAAGLFVYAGGYGCRQARTDRISDTVGRSRESTSSCQKHRHHSG